MPILPNGVTSEVAAPSGGSPRGWTFISTGIECWRKLAFQHVFGLIPYKKADALLLGAAYHLFQEGKSMAEVVRAFPDHAVDGHILFLRRQKGPPLPKLGASVIVEKEFTIFGGLMTSKPDRIEQRNGKPIVRDFKSAATFSEHDDEYWNADGGILGECIAAGTDKAIVDIVRKYEGKSGPDTKLVEVTLTPEKEHALLNVVKQFWADFEWRTKEVAKRKELTAYSQNLKACVGKYGPCPYYARCWKKGKPESMHFKLVEPNRRWANHAGGIDWQKALDKAFDVGRKLV